MLDAKSKQFRKSVDEMVINKLPPYSDVAIEVGAKALADKRDQDDWDSLSLDCELHEIEQNVLDGI